MFCNIKVFLKLGCQMEANFASSYIAPFNISVRVITIIVFYLNIKQNKLIFRKKHHQS